MEPPVKKPSAFNGVNKLIIADLEINLFTHRVTRSGAEITLTHTQFRILLYLASNLDRVIPKSKINAILNAKSRLKSNAVNVHIARLRQKVDRNFFPNLIHTARGKGYFLSEKLRGN